MVSGEVEDSQGACVCQERDVRDIVIFQIEPIHATQGRDRREVSDLCVVDSENLHVTAVFDTCQVLDTKPRQIEFLYPQEIDT